MDDNRSTERDSNGRFLPGRPSPNKRGRPPNRASKSSLVAALDPNAALILRLNRKTVRDTKDGQDREITRLEIAYEVLCKMAIGGDMKAIKLYLEISNAAHAVEKHYREELLGAAIAYKDYWLPIFDERESQGRPVPSQLPHPRDIEIDGDGGITFVGPVDRETDELVRKCVAERDSLIEALRLLRRSDGPAIPARDKLERRLRRQFRELNNALPPRLRVFEIAN